MMPIGAWAQETDVEAQWGASADDLTGQGTLADAFAAAEAENSTVNYIKLLSDVTSADSHTIYGGEFTLDLNGRTLSGVYSALDLKNVGTSVTLTGGNVNVTSKGATAIKLSEGAKIQISDVSCVSSNKAVWIGENCTATINDGTFTATNSSYAVHNEGVLSIRGGVFDGESIRTSVYTAGTSAVTTITGGTFAKGIAGNFEYKSGKLDLSGYADADKLTLFCSSETSVDLGEGNIVLPEGYCFYDGDGMSSVSTLASQSRYVIGLAQAKWGASAEAAAFTYGTLAQAFAAAEAENSTVGYVQLQSDVASEGSHTINGGEFILDLNGKTLQSNSHHTLELSDGKVTITDGSGEQTGKVATTENGSNAVYLLEKISLSRGNPIVTIEGGHYEAVSGSAIEISSGSLTICGGTFTVAKGAQVVSVVSNGNAASSLTIMGGTFDAQCANDAIYMAGNTTISGGTFVGGNRSTVRYIGGTLSFVATEATDDTPGFSPMGLSVLYAATNGEGISLPDGYGIYNYNEIEVLQSELVNNEVYYIGKADGFSFTVTFDPNNGKDTESSETCYSYIGRYTLPGRPSFTAPDGTMFKAWQVGGVEYLPGMMIAVTANIVVKAVWAVPYVVSFDANGGTGDAITPKNTFGDVILPGCPFDGPDGTMFKAWQVGEVEYQPGMMITVTANTVVKAVWAVPYVVSFDANGGTGDAIPSINTLGAVTLPQCAFIAPEGMIFAGWQVGDDENNLYQPGERITVTANTVVKAVWAVPYVVSFDANNGTEETITPENTLGAVTLPECAFTAPEGMIFAGWQVGDDENNLYQPGEKITVTANTVVKAVWTDYVPQIVIKMADAARDGWHGNTIVVKRNGEEIGRATMGYGAMATARFVYDATCEYTFYWDLPELENSWPDECYFEIYVEDKQVFEATRDDCRGFADNQLLHTIEVAPIVDGELTEFSVSTTAPVGKLTYTRTLPNQEWNSLFVPFEIEVTEAFLQNYDVAYFNNMHAYDTDGNGAIDDMTMEVIQIKEGTLHANHPYFIRAKNEAAMAMTLVLNDATLYSTAQENRTSITTSSAYMEFQLSGVYEQVAGAAGVYAINTKGAWSPIIDGATLNPFRLFLKMTTRSGSPVKVEQQALSRVRIRVAGEGTETGVEKLESENVMTEIFDLAGRRVANPQKGSIYVVNGKKVMWK